MPGYPASGANGKVEWVNHTDPVAGANLILTFDSTGFPNQLGYVYELLRLRFTFSTSAAVATRTVNFETRVAGQLEWAKVPTVTQTATLGYQYVFGKGIGDSAVLGFNGRVFGQLPSEFWAFVVDDTAQPQMRTNITNLQAGDAITNIFAQYRISKQ